MKKLLITFVLSAFYATSAAAADFGVNVGASGQVGVFTASATESTGTVAKGNGTEHGAAGYGSIFVELSMADRFMLGVDYVPDALETDTVETAKSDKGVGAITATTVTNTLKVEFENLMTVYGAFMVNDNIYLKAGAITVDVNTKENLATGGKYADLDLDGTMMGIGYHNAMDNGLFFRFEGTYMEFDSTTLSSTGTASDNKITLGQLDGVTGKLSIGKTF